MIVSIGSVTLDVDLPATRSFYETIAGYVPCDCPGCQNFPEAVHHMPQPLREKLISLGINLIKPTEQWVNTPSADGKSAMYGGFYHVCGKIVDGEEPFTTGSVNTSTPTQDFVLSVHTRADLLPRDFSAPVVQIEFECWLPWLLEYTSTEAYPSP